MNGQYPIFTLRTEEIVGRNAVLEQLKAARLDVAQPDSPTRLFYLEGEGGMGKTRILEELAVRKDEVPGQLMTGIIDFYDSRHHSRVSLEESVVNALPQTEEVVAIFSEYRQQLQKFRDFSGLGTVADHEREALDLVFFAAWDQLSASHSIVIRLDTAELLTFQEDTIGRRFELGLPEATSKAWLQNVVGNDNRLRRTLVVVAGRPSDTLSPDLVRLARRGDRNYVARLQGLDQEESETYFERLAQTLIKKSYDYEASQLAELSSEERRRFILLTGGRPIALAVALQLYISDLGGPFREMLASPDARYGPEARAALRQALVNGVVYDVFGAFSQPLRLLPLARRGLTPELLSQLWADGHPRGECEEVIEQLKLQIFIKVRPDGSIVLHDEIADWSEVELYRGKNDERNRIYGRLAAAYEERFKLVRGEIRTIAKETNQLLEPEETPVASGSPSSPTTNENGLYRRLARKVSERRETAIDLLYYLLRFDPDRGYRHYYELAEEAFNVNLADYDAQIHSEFLQWWDARDDEGPEPWKYRAQATEAGITAQVVEADLAVRWVQRQYNQEGPDAKRKTAELVDRLIGAMHPDPVTRDKLGTYKITARSQVGLEDTEVTGIRNTFQVNLRNLQRLVSRRKDKDDIQRFLAEDALAFTEYECGFFERGVVGDYDTAIDRFTASISLYKKLHFQINQARSLNDRAYAMARAGEIQSAIYSINDALDLRIELGLVRVAALSLNTKGIIYVFALKPNTALAHCARALEIFASVNDRFGQMLALNALSEANRRKAGSDGSSTQEKLAALKTAIDCIQQCREYAESLGVSPSLMAEIIDEAGCAWRDLAHFCADKRHVCRDETPCDEAFATAGVLFDEALKLVSGREYMRHLVLDIKTDQAYLAYYQGNLDAAGELCNAAHELVPTAYRHQEARKTHDRRHAYRVQLTKIHALRARLSGKKLNDMANNPPSNPVDAALDLTPWIEAFAVDATQTLYFTSQLPDFRQARQANGIIYEQLQTLSVEILHELADAAKTAESDHAIPRHVAAEFGLRPFIRTQFGVK